MWKKAFVLILATLSVGSMFLQPAQGKEYPTKPIEIICPFTPGSSTDIFSRIVADIATKYLGQPVVVVNKPGALGSLAAADVISSKPDGYKLVPLTNLFFATSVKTQKIPFDPNDLTPLVNFFEIKTGLAVRSDSPWKTFHDVLDYGRRNPGKLKWGHSGRGILGHIAFSMIFKKAGIEAIDVPYKGDAESLVAFLGGHLDLLVSGYGIFSEHVRAGTVRMLIFITDRRYSDLPGVPSAAELGFPEAGEFKALRGFFVHKDTPEEIKKILMDGLKKTYDDPEYKKRFEKLGEEPRFGGPEFIEESIKKAEKLGVPFLKEIGLYVEK